MSRSEARNPESNVGSFFVGKTWSILALFGLCLLLLSAFVEVALPPYGHRTASAANPVAAVKPHAGNTYVVTNTDSSGIGSLPDAVAQSNANYDGTNPNTINFNIPSQYGVNGVYTITVQSNLVITAPVTIDGLNGASCANPPQLSIVVRASYPAQPVIEIDSAGSGSVIRGLVLQNNDDAISAEFSSIFINNSNNDIIECNFIGTDLTGTKGVGTGNGINILNGSNNIIGVPGQGNLISGNANFAGYGGNGINIDNGISTTVQANLIGTDISGSTIVTNTGDGIVITDTNSTGNVIGGSGTGQGNLISGNQGNGISDYNTAGNNTIAGNYIGTNKSGTAAIANGNDGIVVFQGTVGSITAAGDNITQNLISGNGGNGGYGINIYATTPQIISGTVLPQSSKSTRSSPKLAGTVTTTITSNSVGTDASGSNALGNNYGGIYLNYISNVQIGEAGQANLVSGNGGNGVEADNSSNVVVQANYIGTDKTGTAVLANNFSSGIYLYYSSGNLIGGTTAATRNIISGNGADGITLSGESNDTIEGNYIGTDTTGATSLGNQGNGISLDLNSQGNIIGGSDATTRNIISGNAGNGIGVGQFLGGDVIIKPSLNGKPHQITKLPQPKQPKSPVKPIKKVVSATVTNTIASNYIGTDATGSTAIANTGDGILLADTTNVQIGQPGQGNLISGNSYSGIHLTTSGVYGNSGAYDNVAQSNLIGTNAAGTGNVPNQQGGIDLDVAAYNNVIGGSGAGNTVSGNLLTGIALAGSSVYNNTVTGNFVGTDPSGSTALPNSGSGIFVGYYAANNIIGAPGVGNLVSGNTTVGIQFTSANVSNTVQSNFVGTNKAGNAALPNAQAGISIEANTGGTIIGGIGAGNVVSGNGGNGIEINGSKTDYNFVQSNFIGTDSTGNTAIPNKLDGVNVYLAQYNQIGGTTTGQGNVIANNAHNGVTIGSTISDTQTTEDSINQNSIFANGGLGIDLGNDGVTFNNPTIITGPNDLQPYPVISTVVQSSGNYSITGSLNSVPGTDFLIEFYANGSCSPSGHGQGQTYLGSVTVTTNSSDSAVYVPGSATFGVSFPVVANEPIIAATATNLSTGDTSEFSQCQPGGANIIVGSNPNPSVYGQVITLTATVNNTSGGVTPTGSVVFTDTSTNTNLGTATLISGTATLHVSGLAAGNHNIIATYSGDSNYNSNSLTYLQVVNKAATAMTFVSYPNPPLPNQNVVFTATVSVVPPGAGTPTGVVTFTDATTNAVLGTSPLGSNGIATLTAAGSTVQSHNINVLYSGDANFYSSAVINGNASNPAKLVFVSQPGNGQPGQPLTVQPIVAVEDIYGNTTPNYSGVVSITLINNSSGATLGGTTVITVTNGLANFKNIALDKVGNGYSLLAQSYNLTGISTNFNVSAGPIQYTYILPFLANAYTPNGSSGSFTTYLAFQNTGSSTATVSISYFDANGNTVTVPSGTCTSLATLGECLPPNPFPAGGYGTGVITSTQPLNVVVSEATPYGGSAYAINSNGAAGSNSLVAPFALNKSYGGFVTQLTVFNFGDSSTTATVNFYREDGTLQNAATRTLTLAPHTSQVLDQSSSSSNLPVGFTGWAQIQGTGNSQLIAQVLEQNPTNHFVALLNAVASPQSTLYAPTMLNGAFGGFVSGSNIINPNANAVIVNVTYYGSDGSVYPASPFSLPAYAIASIFQGATTAGIGLPNGLLPAVFNGGAIVSVSGGGVVMAVNESAGLTANGTARSGTYTAVSSGSNQIGLPAIANGGDGFTSGLTIFNISSSPVNGTIQYYDVTGKAVNGPQAFSVGPHSSYAAYQGAANLPANFYGTAIVTQDSGSQANAPDALIVTTNMQSANFFYTYTEQNN